MSDEDLVAALKALAHPVRLRVMQALRGAERNVGEIDEVAGIGQPTLSQQLAVLRRAGLVTTRKQAKLVYYRIDEATLAQVSAETGALAGREAGEGGASPGSQRAAGRRPAPGAANFARLG